MSWSAGVNGQSPNASTAAIANPPSNQTMGGATAAEENDQYVIGPGDVLDIRVFGRPQLTRDLVRVDTRGKIRMPLIEEEIQASCRSEASLAEYISAQYLKYVRRPQVDVFIREYNSQPVAIVGAVSKPGRFQLQRQVRLLELLTYAGGPTEKAGRTIQVVHAPNSQRCDNSETSTSDKESALSAYGLSDVLAGTDQSNPFVLPGDVVSVLEADQIFVVGNVIRPSSIPLKEPLTVSRAIAMSGGVLPYTKMDQVRIIRQPAGDLPKQELIVDLKAIVKKNATDVVLQANDIIDVPVSGSKKFIGSLVGSVVPAVTQMPVRVIP
ncbi:MAG TPA: polysaccharide biosynthesis/export family protein [Pyrinomonadaceae bacterium]|nr:polysaccharide biosynthesis/export family protein [Pyrinomonadaceae bacterium]